MRVPNGAMPLVRTVFGDSPEPQIMNDPKSLYQSPSGAQGAVFTQSCKRRRSSSEIRRSSTRARMCSQTGRGRLENRIFGNGVRPEDGPDQVLARFGLSLGVGLRNETAIGRSEILARSRFSLHSTLREHNQGTTHRQVFLPCHPLDLYRQLGGYGDALSNGWRRSGACTGGSFHALMISGAPPWCTLRVAQRKAPNRGSTAPFESRASRKLRPSGAYDSARQRGTSAPVQPIKPTPRPDRAAGGPRCAATAATGARYRSAGDGRSSARGRAASPATAPASPPRVEWRTAQ